MSRGQLGANIAMQFWSFVEVSIFSCSSYIFKILMVGNPASK
jgi:hypothetical protein